MLPAYFHPAGFWALLAVPAILAIHFLQQRLRIVRTSTWFLMENLAPDSAHGRTWERLRSSRALWLQLLAALLLAWVLGEPRWVRRDSRQTVAFVLDASAGMLPFRAAAAAVMGDTMEHAVRGAARTHWLVLTSDPRTTALYRGDHAITARKSLDRWRPALGTHDPLPALRTAQALAGSGGTVWFVTNRHDTVPAGQAALGVGRPIDNVGFASGAVTRDAQGATWRALVRNHSDRPQRREWWVEAGGQNSQRQTLDLAPGGMAELGARLPDGAERVVVRLEGDGFVMDDALPLVRPAAKPLAVAVAVTGGTGDFFKRLIEGIDGVSLAPAPAPGLRVARTAPGDAMSRGAAVLLVPSAPAGTELKVLRAPLVAEKHPLLADLNWQGWLGAGAGLLKKDPTDVPLLWQADAPLVWLDATGRRLTLNFDWSASNAARLPATVLLLRRFAEEVRDGQPGPYAANFDANAQVPLADLDRVAPGEWTVDFEPTTGASMQTRAVPTGELAALRAPGEPGFFILKRGGTALVRGAAQFADVRQGDFRAADTFIEPPAEAEALRERHTRPDPLATLWLALVGLCFLGSWWPGRRRA